MRKCIGSFLFEIRKPKTLIFHTKINAALDVHVPRHLSTAVTHPLHILVALRWLQHARLPALNYFPNILLFIACKFPVSYFVSVVVTAFCWQVKTTERIPLAVLNLEHW